MEFIVFSLFGLLTLLGVWIIYTMMTKKESLQDAISDVEVQVKADAVKLEQEVVDEVKTVVKKVRAKKAPAANTAAQ
jgi:hypothetical protein